MPPSAPPSASDARHQAEPSESPEEDDWIHIRRTGSPYSASPPASEVGDEQEPAAIVGNETAKGQDAVSEVRVANEQRKKGILVEEGEIEKLRGLMKTGLSLLNNDYATAAFPLHSSHPALITLSELRSILTAAEDTMNKMNHSTLSPCPGNNPSSSARELQPDEEASHANTYLPPMFIPTESFVSPVIVPRKWDMHMAGGLDGLMEEYRELKGEGHGVADWKGKKRAIESPEEVSGDAEQREKKRNHTSVPAGIACHGARSAVGQGITETEVKPEFIHDWMTEEDKALQMAVLSGAPAPGPAGSASGPAQDQVDGAAPGRKTAPVGNVAPTIFEDVYASRQRSRPHRTLADPAEQTVLKAIFAPDSAHRVAEVATEAEAEATAAEEREARVVNMKGGAATVFEDAYESRKRGREQTGQAGRVMAGITQGAKALGPQAADSPIVSYQEAIRPFGFGVTNVAEVPFVPGVGLSFFDLPLGDRAAMRERAKQCLAELRAQPTNGTEFDMGESVLQRARREASAERRRKRPPPQPLPQPFAFFGISRVDPNATGDQLCHWPERTPASVPYSHGIPPQAPCGTIALRYSDLADFEGSDYPGLAQLMAERLQINARLITKACLKLDLTEDSPVMSELTVQEELKRAIDPELHTSMAGTHSWRLMRQGAADDIVKRVVTHHSEVVKQDVAEKLVELGAKEYERRMALHSEMDREKLVGALMREALATADDEEGGEAVETVYEEWIARTRSVLDRLYVLLGDIYGEDKKSILWGQLIRPGGQIDTLVGLARICVMWHDGIAKEKISQKLKHFNV